MRCAGEYYGSVASLFNARLEVRSRFGCTLPAGGYVSPEKVTHPCKHESETKSRAKFKLSGE